MMPEKTTLWSKLTKRYPATEFALMREVSDSAGHNRSRSADFVAVNLWPSRGLGIEGIEVKSYRNDWLRELKNPQKAENIFKYCDFWWLLTTEDNVAKLDEIPDTWGWLCAKGNKIVVKKPAPKLSPLPTSKSFMVAMLKRAASKDGFVHVETIQERIDIATQSGKDIAYRETNRITSRNTELEKIVKDFEAASGINLERNKYNIGKIGEAVKFIQNGGVDDLLRRINQFKIGADDISQTISKVITELTEIKK